jgi:hypothetical protein
MDFTAIWNEGMTNLEKVRTATGVPPWAMMVIGFIMFGGWTVCYALIIIRCFKQKAYGIPVISSCLNVVWEFIFSFNLAGALSQAIRWGNRFWLIPDSINVIQTYMYGKDMQTHPWVRKHFRTIVTLTLISCFIGEYLFLIYFNDIYGVLLSLLLDILLAALFCELALERSDLRGLSLPAAWWKMIGDVAGITFLYLWWPSQFIHGELRTMLDERTQVVIPEPPSWGFMYFLYVGIVALNGVYIYLLTKRTREIREEARAAEAMG